MSYNPNHLVTLSAASTMLNFLKDHSEFVSNKVTSLSSSSTDMEYPSARCVYDLIGDVESILEVLLEGDSTS